MCEFFQKNVAIIFGRYLKLNDFRIIFTRHRVSLTNCHLSRDDSANLDVTSSYVFYPDADWDYYQRIGSGSACFRHPEVTTGSSGSSSSSVYHHQRPPYVIGEYQSSEGKTSRKFPQNSTI